MHCCGDSTFVRMCALVPPPLQTPLTVPQSERRGDRSSIILAPSQGGGNVLCGWHGNGLSGFGGAACRGDFRVVATLLQHRERWRGTARPVCWFPVEVGGVSDAGRWNRQQAGNKEVMRKGRVGCRREGRRRNQIIPLCSSCHRSCKRALISSAVCR